MYRKTEVLAVHGAKLMKNLEFTKKETIVREKDGFTILFHRDNQNDKYFFEIKNEENLKKYLISFGYKKYFPASEIDKMAEKIFKEIKILSKEENFFTCNYSYDNSVVFKRNDKGNFDFEVEGKPLFTRYLKIKNKIETIKPYEVRYFINEFGNFLHRGVPTKEFYVDFKTLLEVNKNLPLIKKVENAVLNSWAQYEGMTYLSVPTKLLGFEPREYDGLIENMNGYDFNKFLKALNINFKLLNSLYPVCKIKDISEIEKGFLKYHKSFSNYPAKIMKFFGISFHCEPQIKFEHFQITTESDIQNIPDITQEMILLGVYFGAICKPNRELRIMLKNDGSYSMSWINREFVNYGFYDIDSIEEYIEQDNEMFPDDEDDE